MVPVFSGHTGVPNVELLIYIFFCGGEGTISVIYWETQFILLFVRVGIFLGGRGGDTEVVKFKLPHPLIKTFWTTGAGQNPFTVSGRLILSSTVFISSDSYQFV